jgi:hypothetical protein
MTAMEQQFQAMNVSNPSNAACYTTMQAAEADQAGSQKAKASHQGMGLPSVFGLSEQHTIQLAADVSLCCWHLQVILFMSLNFVPARFRGRPKRSH